MLQTINGFCKLSVTRRPTFFVPNSKKKCKRHLVIKKTKQTIKFGVEEDYLFCFYLPQLYCRLYCLLLAYPPFPFLLFCFLFKRVFTSAMPCRVAAAFDLRKHKQKPSHMSDSREDVNILFTERKRRVNTDTSEMKTEHLQ